ncbi:putative tRNA pseudouridine synthase Pus10 [Fasciola gigantica]|uniref:tRNA pseudouridine(55) synthase n=1 Tax=Fasciola gigantica TaxID=46835 RepID=A0A504YF77_FASGI|nr:putative tRNA pseudouridine synthase Pus10 [Fasciola gigantica]
MKTEVGRTQVALLLREYDCCARCVQRMLYGATSKPKDFVHLRDAIRESPLCPVCCGLLHHPRMCAFPPGYTRIKYRSSADETERNLLAELVSKLDVTDFEYLACQFKLTEPVNHMFREHIMWTRLYNLLPNYMGQKSHYDPNWQARYRRPSERITCLFNFRDLEEWKRSRITQKQVWYWIVSPSLSDVLGVPTICQESELRDPAFLRSNNIDPTLCDPGALSMVISTVLSDPQTHAECIDFLGRAKRSGNGLVRRLASDLLNLSRTKQLKNERNEHSTTDQSTLFEFGRDRMANLIKQLWQQTPSSWLALQTKPCLPRIARITLERLVQITLAGRYVKLSRRMPQTWRMIDANQKLPSCVKEIILGPIREQFGTASRLRFFSASSEDADARCLGFGRPFIVRVENFESFLPDLIRSLSEGGHKPQDLKFSSEKPPIDLLRLASMINARGGGKVMVRDLQMISAENAKKVIKYVKKSKFKRCRALCWCPLGGLTTELIQQLHQQCSTLSRIPQPANGATLVWPPEPVSDSPSSYARIRFGPISVDQCTPICRLHRQPFSCRSTKIQSFELASFEAAMAIPDMDLEDYESWLKIYPLNELFILHIHCAAGTYVKEFVHGDLGRSVPNLSNLIGRQLDLLALDICAIDLDWPPRLPDPKPIQKTLS